ncbi:hypothetical protein ACHAXS_005848 [Conticribra weissflogii]
MNSNAASRQSMVRDEVIKNFFRRQQPREIFLTSLFAVVFATTLSFFIRDDASSFQPDQVVTRELKDCQGWVRPKAIFGHVHMAKTAGTEINGLLASKYERVCGHKGYSYDFRNLNRRRKEYSSEHDGDTDILKTGFHDLIAKVREDFNRGRVPLDIMKEVGFDDCDFISLENRFDVWGDIQLDDWPLELHVPCREPLSHLMSFCNYMREDFSCDSDDRDFLEGQIVPCVQYINRFDPSLAKIPNFSLKCFDPLPPERYVDYMGRFLQSKRIPTEYFHVDTNQPRSTKDECLWTAGEDFQRKVREILIEKYDFFRFCDECMSTENELPLEGMASVEDYL